MFNTIKSNLKSSEDKIINFFIKKIKNYETTNTNIKQSNLKERKGERKKKRKKERREKKKGKEEEETSISEENIFDDLKENAKLQSNVDTEVQINAIYKSIKQNYIFYIFYDFRHILYYIHNILWLFYSFYLSLYEI